MVTVLVAGLCLASCTADGEPSAGAQGTTSAAPTPAPVTGPCDMPTLADDESFQADADGGSVAALVFGTLPPDVGSQLKIVWRVTGTGPLDVVATRPDGSSSALTFGPEEHGGSTFHRPGDEWGTGFLFDTAGCWLIHVRRGDVTARVPIEVVEKG
jgi:hypothetical protein